MNKRKVKDYDAKLRADTARNSGFDPDSGAIIGDPDSMRFATGCPNVDVRPIADEMLKCGSNPRAWQRP